MKNILNILIFQTSQIIFYNSPLSSFLAQTTRDLLVTNFKLAQLTNDRLKLI